jgi:hypothetical protein
MLVVIAAIYPFDQCIQGGAARGLPIVFSGSQVIRPTGDPENPEWQRPVGKLRVTRAPA